jgi:hypothetical protein
MTLTSMALGTYFVFFFPISVYIFTTYLTGIAYLGGTQIVINDHILKS